MPRRTCVSTCRIEKYVISRYVLLFRITEGGGKLRILRDVNIGASGAKAAALGRGNVAAEAATYEAPQELERRPEASGGLAPEVGVLCYRSRRVDISEN